ncbi:MAG: MerR family transcriptional regulator [Candidatus Limnocylindrales bacterium]
MSLYSLADLCDLADVTARTVRFYIAQGLLRGPDGGGVAARYDDGHLQRLRLIRRLQKENLPLADVRKRLAALTDDDVTRLVETETAVRDSAAEYIATVLAERGVGRSLGGAPAPARTTIFTPAHAPPPMLLPAPPEPEAAGSGRSQWERIALDEDVELHVRRPQTREGNRRIQRLIDTWRITLEEDRS